MWGRGSRSFGMFTKTLTRVRQSSLSFSSKFRPIFAIQSRFFSSKDFDDNDLELSDFDKELDDLDRAFAELQSLGLEDEFDLKDTDDSDKGDQEHNEGEEEKDPYEGILFRHNPPKLSKEHYEMLQDVAAIYPSEEERKKAEADKREARNKEAAAWEEKFGISRDMYEVYLQNFPDDDEGLANFEAESYAPQEYDFSREPGRTFTPSDVEALEQIPEWRPRGRGRFPGQCRFCDEDLTPNKDMQITYTNIELLYEFINERGMITHRKFNHNCAKHQRRIMRAIKRARTLGLLPYISNWRVPMGDNDYHVQ